MFRQSPRRNGRNRGLKIKHVLRISLLLGVSVWLLYQVHHSNDKNPSDTTNVTNHLQTGSSKDTLKLGRKDLRPKVKETHDQDKKETEEHQANEEGNENEVEEFVHDHDGEEGEDMKHEQDEENENTDDGEESQEKEHEHIKGSEDEEADEKDNGEEGGERNGVENEENRYDKRGKKEQVNKQNETKERGKKEVKEAHKRERKDVRQSDVDKEIKGYVNENKSNAQRKDVIVEQAETNSEKRMNPSMKEVEVSSPSDNGHQIVIKESHKSQYVNRDNGNMGPSTNQRQSASNQSHRKTNNEPDNNSDASTNATTISEKEKQGDVKPTTKVDENQNKVDNPLTQTVPLKQTVELISSGNEENASPYSYIVPSFEPKTAKSMNRNSTISGNEKNDSNEEPETEADEKESNGNVLNDEESESSSSVSILEEEKEVLTDLETLPDSGTGGSMTHEDAATA